MEVRCDYIASDRLCSDRYRANQALSGRYELQCMNGLTITPLPDSVESATVETPAGQFELNMAYDAQDLFHLSNGSVEDIIPLQMTSATPKRGL